MLKLFLGVVLLFAVVAVQGQLNESEKPNQINVYLDQNAPYSSFDAQQNAQGILVDYWQHWSSLTGISVKYYPSLKRDIIVSLNGLRPAVYSGLQADAQVLSKLEKQSLFAIYGHFYYPADRYDRLSVLFSGKKAIIKVGGLLPQAQQLPFFSTRDGLSYQVYPGLLDLLLALYNKQIDALLLFEGRSQNLTLLNKVLSLLLDDTLVGRESDALYLYAHETQEQTLEWIDWGTSFEPLTKTVNTAIIKARNSIWRLSASMLSTLLALVLVGCFILFFIITRFRYKKDRQFKDLLNSSPYPVVIFSVDGSVIYYFNEEFKVLLPLKKLKKNYVFTEPENQLFLSRFINYSSHKTVITAEPLRLLVDNRFHDLEISAKRVYYKGKTAWLCYFKDINTLLQIEQKLTEERALLRKVLDSIPEQIVFKSAKETVIGCNQAWAKANHTSVGKATGRRLSALISSALIKVQKQQELTVWTGEHFKKQAWQQHGNHPSRLINITKLPLYNDKGTIFAILSIESDVTGLYDLTKQLEDENLQRKKIEIALSKQNLLLSTVFAASVDPIALLDKDGRVIGSNYAFAMLMDSNPHDIIGKLQSTFLSADRREWVERKNSEVIASGEPLIFDELIFFNGKEIWYEVSKTPFNDQENQYQGIVIMARDITLHKQTEEKLTTEASDFELKMLHDPLTGIANRRAFDVQFKTLWQQACEQQDLLSVVMCDVDFFKAYNDNYGHPEGDKVLQGVAQALDNCCVKLGCFVARYGGEEFVVIIKGGNATKALKVAESLRQGIIGANIEHLHSSVSSIVTMSFGLSSILPSKLNTMEILLAEADNAMYNAKKSGRDQICVH